MAINYELINKGGISLGTNFELLSEKPLDSRLVVPSLDGLQNYIDSAAAYEGMIAYVSSEKKHYEVKVIDGVLSYRPFGLTEAELNDLITNATTAAMEFKGATATLPENPAKGDMYKVAGENINIKIDDVDAQLGDSIVYDGTKWFLIPSGDDIEDTWRPVEGVNNDATLKFVDGDKTVAAVAADGTIKYNHATVATPVDVTAEGDEKTRTYITAVETDGYGHITGYKTATENVEDTNTEYTFESQVESSSVYFNVTPNAEGATEQTVYVDAYSKNEADGKFVAKEEAKSLVADTEIAKLAKVSEGANKVEASTNGKIKIDGVDTTVYEHPETHAASEIIYQGGNGDLTVQEAINLLGHPVQKVSAEDASIAIGGTIARPTVGVQISAKQGNALTLIDEEGGQENGLMVTVHEHNNKEVLDDINDTRVKNWDTITQAKLDIVALQKAAHGHENQDELNKIADGDVAKWNGAYTHSQADHAPADAQANIIEVVKVNGEELTITDKAVDITIPTGALAGKDKVAKTDLDETLTAEINNKVASVAAGDASVTVGGTATAPTVAAKISAAEGNALTLAEDGLKVIIPESTKVEASETNGNIKVDGQEVTVYEHPESHTASEISDFTTEVAKVKVDEAVQATQDGNGKVIVDTYAEKATTLAGYGIGDAYTKTEVEALLTWGSF